MRLWKEEGYGLTERDENLQNQQWGCVELNTNVWHSQLKPLSLAFASAGPSLAGPVSHLPEKKTKLTQCNYDTRDAMWNKHVAFLQTSVSFNC